MAKEVNLKAIISCVDRLSPVLKASQKRIQAFGKSMTVLNRAGRNVGRSFSNLGATIAKPATMIAGVLGYSLTSAARSFAGYADALAATAQRAGVTTTELQRLQYAAAVNGASAETMTSGLERLNRTLYDAASGKSKDAEALFRTLGISIKNADGSVRDAAQIMPLLAEGFALNADAATRAKMATVLFGGAGTDLIPLLSMGTKGLDAMNERARRFGFIVSDEAVNAGGLLNNLFAELDMSTRAFTGELIKSAIPAIVEIGEAFMQWLAANRGLIASNVADWIKRIGDAVRSLNWDAIKWFAEVFATGAVASKLFAVGQALVVLGKAFWAATGPIGAAVAALIAAYEIFEHWDEVKKYLSAMSDFIWAWAKELFAPLANLVPDWMKNLFSGDAAASVQVQQQALATPNAQALAMSASGSVSGSLDVNVHNTSTGETERQRAALRGGIRVSGDPGYRDAYYGGD